ncbi:MAG TPA: hydantoinase/oxoprolinase family protein, partial [Candidatus Limnocylindrales bacterium]|nr:hydantoinase/oxoprolinase family protein [Candidatus Limnocylindrales bacterium]
RVIVVSLRDSETDPSGELAVKRTVEKDYPRHYLGAVPCLLASEVTARPGAERRTATAVLNAYLHPEMTKVLYKADEDQRRDGYPHPLLIVQGSGGVARVAKTRAIETYNSGPVGGVHGSVRLLEQYSLENAVSMDIGGTSTDVSVVIGGRAPFADDPEIAGIPVHVPLLAIEAIGGGGGSIARKTESGYTVGPDSAGAVPGPACYGLGGTQPTVTDAEVVLGHIDPDWFLGGRRRLDAGRARASLERIASGDSTEHAAWEVRQALVGLAAATVRGLVERSGVPPSEFVLFAFGGAGGLFAADVARAAGIPRVYSLVNSSVFSAFGVAGMDLSHVYETRAGDGLEDRLEALRNRAKLDAAGEGFSADELSFQLELETPDGLEIVPLDGDLAGAAKKVPATTRAVRLRSTSRIPHAPLVAAERSESGAEAARKGERALWRPGGPVTAAVYDRELLRAGNAIEGPALVESADTTILCPEWARLTVDEYGSLTIEERA